eukprot:c39814_g1_i1.p1 GENE.c39814_g1_i1~~c39814_g1_i1.p1  ORF type:complete len:434 (+),score=93.37 c39814_g1_i1:23-1324(+)
MLARVRPTLPAFARAHSAVRTISRPAKLDPLNSLCKFAEAGEISKLVAELDTMKSTGSKLSSSVFPRLADACIKSNPALAVELISVMDPPQSPKEKQQVKQLLDRLVAATIRGGDHTPTALAQYSRFQLEMDGQTVSALAKGCRSRPEIFALMNWAKAHKIRPCRQYSTSICRGLLDANNKGDFHLSKADHATRFLVHCFHHDISVTPEALSWVVRELLNTKPLVAAHLASLALHKGVKVSKEMFDRVTFAIASLDTPTALTSLRHVCRTVMTGTQQGFVLAYARAGATDSVLQSEGVASVRELLQKPAFQSPQFRETLLSCYSVRQDAPSAFAVWSTVKEDSVNGTAPPLSQKLAVLTVASCSRLEDFTVLMGVLSDVIVFGVRWGQGLKSLATEVLDKMEQEGRGAAVDNMSMYDARLWLEAHFPSQKTDS